MATPDTPPRIAVESLEAPALRLRNQGELLAAIPVLIGFHPRDSLVLLAIGGRSGRRLGLTVRVDLPGSGDVATVAATAVRSLLLDAPSGAAVIVLGGRGGTDPPCRDLVDVVVRALEGHGVGVHAAVWAESTSAGARWTCYDPCVCSGVLPDPTCTPFAAAAVAGGQVVHADRAELERLVAPADTERIRRREVLLTRSIDELSTRADAGIPGPAAGRRVVDTAIDDAAAGRLVLDDARVLALAGALVVPAVRDAALLRCAGPAAAAAEQLWTALVRETPDPEAAEPAALLAVSALLRGDGALANVALDRAQRAWPGHHLTEVLRSVAAAGIRPDQIRACVRQGLSEPGPVRASPGPARGRRRTVRDRGRRR